MPLFYQHSINEAAKLGVWRIAEDELFFLESVPLQRSITHPHKRLQHLAGRWLLKYLYADFPYDLIKIADTRKPFLLNEAYHFSISHCGDYAAAIVSNKHRVGVDIEKPAEKIERIQYKFLNDSEIDFIDSGSWRGLSGKLSRIQMLTLLWSAKEAVFKWYGHGEVDFSSHILLQKIHFTESNNSIIAGEIDCEFLKIATTNLTLKFHWLEEIWLVYVVT
ncbi:MAG: 4-phosphopantetheinyl transferase [Bacteroidetes bacterium]|nr:MAG: 4-phosphopantetheinyl transferase [Bacteroidota bacterium]